MNTKYENKSELITCFKKITDPRIIKKTRHLLIDIIVISICAVIIGAQGWEDIEQFGKVHYGWLSNFLELPNKIPGHDTFRRVFEQIDPKEFTNCFLEWVEIISSAVHSDIISIDGKTARHSFDTSNDKSPIHMVSAFSAANRLVLGQVKTNSKSNEITAIPALIKLLNIKGCVITIDAMGCQKDISNTITNKGGDWVLALKGNQGNLHDDVKIFFEDAPKIGIKGFEYEENSKTEKNHGRIEKRRYWHSGDVQWLRDRHPAWQNIVGIGMVESTRTIKGKTTIEYGYHITSFGKNVSLYSKAVRSHWGIENKLHWVLDTVFREDESRIRNNDAPQNFAVIRHFAINLLRKETTCKKGVKAKMLLACMDISYLQKVVFG